jgi:hypothetical protein
VALGHPDGGHHADEKVDDPNIDIGHAAGAAVAQEQVQLVHDMGDRPFRVAIGAVERRAGMGIDQPQPGPRGQYRRRRGDVRCAQKPNRRQQKPSSIHQGKYAVIAHQGGDRTKLRQCYDIAE